MELDLIYKRYKLMKHQNDTSLKDIEEEAKEFVQQYKAGKAKYEDRIVRGTLAFNNTLG